MDRLISANDLKETLVETLESIKASPKMDGQEIHIIAATHALIQMIDDAPTIWAGDENDLSFKILDDYEREKLFEYQSLGHNIDHLRKLVQAGRDGRLVVLPCYTGDKVYMPLLGKILELEVGNIVLNGGVTTIYYYRSSLRSSPDDFGKTVFLTREEAEAALKGGAE